MSADVEQFMLHHREAMRTSYQMGLEVGDETAFGVSVGLWDKNGKADLAVMVAFANVEDENRSAIHESFGPFFYDDALTHYVHTMEAWVVRDEHYQDAQENDIRASENENSVTALITYRLDKTPDGSVAVTVLSDEWDGEKWTEVLSDQRYLESAREDMYELIWALNGSERRTKAEENGITIKEILSYLNNKPEHNVTASDSYQRYVVENF